MSKSANKHDIKLGRDELQSELTDLLVRLNRYKLIISIVVVALIYGFFVWRINTLNNSQPVGGTVDSQTTSLPMARINKQTVQQLEALRDNSVNVQALFDQARSNPFEQ